MRANSKLYAIAAATILMGTVLAACGSNQSAPTTLVVYSGRSESLVKPLYDKFTQQTGIQISAQYGDSAELAARIAEEGSRTPAQVFFSQDAGALGALVKAGVFAGLPTGVADTVPAAYKTGEWTGVSARSRSLVYDPKQFPNPPQTVFALTGPEYKGKVGWAPANASFQSFVTAMRITQGDAKTKKWLEDMKANGTQSFEKNPQIVAAVNDGVIGIGLVNHYYWYELAKELGKDKIKVAQEFTSPGDPGSLVNVAGIGITAANANNAEAAKFISFLLSADSQNYFATETFEYPVVAGIPGPEGAPPLSELKGPPVRLNDLNDLPATQEMLRQVGLI